ncbi:MAG: hypothetical protein AB1445_13985 [Bacillota bacterium]
MDDPFRFVRFHSPALGFVTYVPHDLLPGSVSGDGGDSVVVGANYQGNQREDVYLTLSFFPAGVSLEQAQENTFARLAGEGLSGVEPIEPGDHPNA